eukprot:3451367-Amphidinium_carterae.1
MLRLIVLLNKCCLEWKANRKPGSGPALCERQEKLQVRPRLHHEDAPSEEMEWPFLFEGHTLERELE